MQHNLQSVEHTRWTWNLTAAMVDGAHACGRAKTGKSAVNYQGILPAIPLYVEKPEGREPAKRAMPCPYM